jgi:hypothetical protein
LHDDLATRSLTQLAAALSAGLLLAACATTEGQPSGATPIASAPPASAFAPALRAWMACCSTMACATCR